MKRTWRIHTLAIAIAAVIVFAAVGTSDAAITLKGKTNEKEYKFQLYGFSQLEMRGGDGQSSEGGVFFKAQRIRLGTKYFHGGWFAKLFLDFNQSYTSKEGGLPKVIKDAFVGYKWSNAAFIRLGMIKTPHGMSFTIPGWNLDIAERNGIDKGLSLERDFGLLLSGRFIGGEDRTKKMPNGTEMGHEKAGYGFGYDIGVFNPAGRSKAVMWDSDQLGDALAYAARIHWDNGLPFHFEASWAKSEKACGYMGEEECEDYTSYNVGVHSILIDRTLDLKFEYYSSENIRGVEGWDQDTISFTVGYYFTPQLEAVVKHYMGSSDRGGESYDLDNTYVGFNFFVAPFSKNPRHHQCHKIVLNYILSSGDEKEWSGIGGYRDDGWVMQWQYKF